jgi:hypothetical protein
MRQFYKSLSKRRRWGIAFLAIAVAITLYQGANQFWDISGYLTFAQRSYSARSDCDGISITQIDDPWARFYWSVDVKRRPMQVKHILFRLKPMVFGYHPIATVEWAGFAYSFGAYSNPFDYRQISPVWKRYQRLEIPYWSVTLPLALSAMFCLLVPARDRHEPSCLSSTALRSGGSRSGSPIQSCCVKS